LLLRNRGRADIHGQCGTYRHRPQNPDLHAVIPSVGAAGG
jgi:hypothetical protein